MVTLVVIIGCFSRSDGNKTRGLRARFLRDISLYEERDFELTVKRRAAFLDQMLMSKTLINIESARGTSAKTLDETNRLGS